MSKADIDAYRRKDAARKKKNVNLTIQVPNKMCKDVTPPSHYRSKQSYRKALKKTFEFLAKFSTKEDICYSWLK